MLKKICFAALAAVTLIMSQANAADPLAELQGLDVSAIQTSDLAVEVDGLANIDIDNLADKADGEKSNDAIEACFRRFSCHGYGYRYSYPSYGYHCYRPCVPLYSYYPVYHYVTYPVYTCFWGCY